MSKDANFGKYLSMIYRLTHKHLRNEYEKYGIGSGQSPFLFSLYKEDGVTLDRLTKIQAVDKATTTRAISKLEESGYVVRKPHPTDKRSYTVHLTKKSMDLKPRLKDRMDSLKSVMYTDLCDEDIETTRRVLKKMSENLKNYTEEEWSAIDE